MNKWVTKIQTNPYLLRPEELLALRRAKFPFLGQDAQWINQYLRLCAFGRKHGHTCVPMRGYGNLAQWVFRQRGLHRMGQMSPQRQAALNRLQFRWAPKEDLWEHGLTQFKRFVEQHGHAKPLARGPSLRAAKFLMYQRRLYRQGLLDPKRQQVLESLGVTWTPQEDSWNEQLAQLKEFIQRHGHTNIPLTPVFRHLADFLYHCRWFYRQGRLRPERRRALEALGVARSPRQDAWNRNLAELKQFIKHNGHANVPHACPGFSHVATFIKRQRELYRQGLLPPERQKVLENLGVAWSMADRSWNRALAELKQFIAQNGHAKLPPYSPEFLCRYRRLYRQGRLPPERQQALKSLGVRW